MDIINELDDIFKLVKSCPEYKLKKNIGIELPLIFEDNLIKRIIVYYSEGVSITDIASLESLDVELVNNILDRIVGYL